MRWAIIVAHRRCGKTVACICDMIMRATENKIPNARYAIIGPTYSHIKDIAWPYLKQYAAPLITEVWESELRVVLINGAWIRLYSADNPDRLRGIYLDGVVLDEFGVMKPEIWGQVVRPALSDRQGWATFIGTPKGRTGLFNVWKKAGEEPADWFRLMLKASETGWLPESELQDARRGITPEEYEQEYECSFEAAIIGAYYGRQIAELERTKRIAGIPYDPGVLVYTAWDLGHTDATAIWFAQVVGKELHIIDYYENSGLGADHYVRVVRDKPYTYATHIVPHDAAAHEYTTGQTRLKTMQDLGLRNTMVCPIHRVEEGINAVRMKLPMCWFDKEKCAQGIEALKLYRCEWDSEKRMLRAKPVHDWSSNAADAFRYLCYGLPRAEGPASFDRDIIYPKGGIY